MFILKLLCRNAFKNLLKPLLFLFFWLTSASVAAQHDSLILNNGDIIVGELKSLDGGVLTIETDYSKNDFTIEWKGVKKIYSKSRFLITLSNGYRVNGSFKSGADSGKVIITDVDGNETTAMFTDIVFLKGLKSDFWSRANASIDLGFSITKANNLRQYTSNVNVGYLADKWQLSLFYNDLRSKQDSVNETRRTEWSPSFKYFLQNDWFLSTTLDFLSNTEQALKLRSTGKVGAGKYLIHTNKAYFGLGGGLSFNNESFTNATSSRNSLEGYGAVEANLFDLKDLSLLTNLYVYPSFTESGRWRSDFTLSAKYDLPLNFYIKLNCTLNYDNKPAVSGKETDYITSFSVGWEL